MTEGSNISPVNLNNGHLFDPHNPSHAGEYSKFLHDNVGNKKFTQPKEWMNPGEPLYGKHEIPDMLKEMKDVDDGWGALETPMMHAFLRSKANKFDGAIVNENGKRNIMSIPGNNTKSIFNSGEYRDPNNILKSGLGLSVLDYINTNKEQ